MVITVSAILADSFGKSQRQRAFLGTGQIGVGAEQLNLVHNALEHMYWMVHRFSLSM